MKIGGISCHQIGHEWYMEFAKFRSKVKAEEFASAWHLIDPGNITMRRRQLKARGKTIYVRVGTQIGTIMKMYDLLEDMK